MPRATFAKDFRWSPKANVRIAFKAGKSYPITTACHIAAVKAGAIVSASGGRVAGSQPLPAIGEKPSSQQVPRRAGG